MQVSKLHFQTHATAHQKNTELNAPAPEVASQSQQRGQADVLSGNVSVTTLLSQLKSLPDVRGELVREAAVKVAQGEYLTREAALDAAAVILNKE